jgi:TRAP-type C4-dicarboxylate transport system permease small subunit
MTFVERLAESFVRILALISAMFLTAAVTLNFANVIGRYLLRSPIVWAEEGISYCIIASVFCAVPVLGWKKRHMRMDILVSLLPTIARTALDMAVDLSVAVLVLSFAVFVQPLLAQLLSTFQRSDAMRIPMFIPYSLVTIGMALLGFLILLRIILDFRRSRQSN